MINTVYELITDVMAKQYPDRERQYPDHWAFRYLAADGETVVEKTYAQYVQDIRRAVTYFKENIPDIKGKRVGIMSRNCYEYGVNSFGAILAGAVVVTINQKKTWPELEYELGLVEPSLIVNDGIDYGAPTSRPPTAINSARWTPSRTARLQSLLTAWAMMI